MHDNFDRDARTGRRVALAGIVASALLATLNIVVGITTGSTSVFATGIEFAGDVLASTVVLLGMIVAVKPADENHPYGHGRIETLAAFIVGIILVAGGVWHLLELAPGRRRHAPATASACPETIDCKSHRGTARFGGGFCDKLFRTARNALILNGEMSEWSIEHAWKTNPARLTE